MHTYSLDDRINLDEYKNKTVQWLINANYNLVKLAKDANEFKLNKEAMEYLKYRKTKVKQKQYYPNYYVADKHIAAAINKIRSISQI